MQKQLTKQEQEEYTKIKQNQFGVAEEQASALCLQYYLAYREHTNITSDKISLAFKCAFFMAQKSQFSVNMKGEKVRGIAFSLNKLLKDHKLDDTMFMLKQMTRKIRFIDQDTSTYLNNIVKQISFLITLHSKFQKTFSQKLQLKQRQNPSSSSQTTYTKTFTSYAWLLFIIVKNQVLKRSLQLLPNTCMVAHIICSMLVLAWDYIKPEALMRGDKRLTENSSTRDIKRIIKQKVLEIFCIKDINQYAKIANSFEEYFNHMIEINLFRMNQDKWDFLSPENINVNYRKIDKYYQQSLSIDHLDERIFFKERTMNLTPSKFTPFARQGYANKFQKQPIGNKLNGPLKPSKQQTFNSHRVLNYEAAQRQLQTTKNLQIHQIKLPKNIIQSPSMVRVPLVMATPISTGMQMYNYLNEKKKRIKEIHTQKRNFDKNVSILIEQVFENIHKGQNDKINQDTKTQIIVALYKIFSEEYLANNNQKDTNQLMGAFLALSMELVFFVSNISLTFDKIEEELQIHPFEMWKAIDYFLKSDKSIPFPIKLHFLDLQVSYVSYKIWDSMQMIRRISSMANNKPQSQQDPQFQKLFKRLLHQTAFQITKLSTLLQIKQQDSQNIFEIMKQIFICYTELLYHRHLDQLILCSIYANCKNIYSFMFNDMKECYFSSNPNLKDIIEDIIVRVYVADGEMPVDIISFYNSVFIPIANNKLKEFITNIRTNGNVDSKNNKKNTLLMSPMKAIIPRQINFKSKSNANVNNGKGKNNGLTPQTQLLYAYNESPILKYEVNSFKPPLKSKRILDYAQKTKKNPAQELTDILPSRPTTSDNNISPSGVSNFQSTTDFINKHYSKKPTVVQQPQPHIQTFHGHQGHQPQTLQLPLQTLAKQNQNPPHSASSHRTLFDQKKQGYQQHQTSQIDQTKYKNKNYQMTAFRRE